MYDAFLVHDIMLIFFQNWRAIERVNQLYILIPMINSLKGTLEMNLSSRLSTSVSIPLPGDTPLFVWSNLRLCHFQGKHRRIRRSANA